MTNQLAIPEYRAGQIWKDRLRNPINLFLVTHVYERVYQDGSRAHRVVGFHTYKTPYDESDPLESRLIGTPTPGVDGRDLRDLDARSVEKMYPHKMWEPYEPIPEENK